MHVWMPEVKPNTTHVVGHFRRELFSLFGFWMGQVVEKQLVQPEGEREGDYKRKKETGSFVKTEIEMFSSFP